MPGASTPTDPRESHRDNALGRASSSLLAAWFPSSATSFRPSRCLLNDSSVLASSTLKLSPSAFLILARLKSLQGGATPLWPIGFSVYASPLSFTLLPLLGCRQNSARGATRDTGGWLALTQPGLAPGKKRQASLSALTGQLNRPALEHQRKSRSELKLWLGNVYVKMAMFNYSGFP
jgi:hypothetical protein